MMSWMIFTLMLAVLDALQAQGLRLDDIYWNTSNPIFRIDNTDHIIDVNKNNLPFEYDQVNIICPAFSSGTSEEDAEQYIIYNVSKEEYDSCRITTANPRIIAICDKPTKVMYFTITFRSFTPQPGGLEFRPGQDYYFISTSNGRKSGLRSLVGGKCGSHHMKIIFKVCCDEKSKVKKLPSGYRPDGVSMPTRRTPNTTKKPHRKGQFIPPYKPARPRPAIKQVTSTPRSLLPPGYVAGGFLDGYQPRDRWQPPIKVRDNGGSSSGGNKKTRHRNKNGKGKSPNDTGAAQNDLLSNKKNSSTSTLMSSSTWLLSIAYLLFHHIFISR